MGDAAIQAKTGRDWAAWCRLLDKAGALKMSHAEIARLVNTKHDAGGWYSQSVTVGYERLRGLRAEHQRRGGLFEASVGKTLPIPARTVFTAFTDDRIRRGWLKEKIHIRKATAPKSVRITWPGGTSVEVWITVKGRQKCVVAVQHSKLPGQKARERKKVFWKTALERLAEEVKSRKAKGEK
jgi:hypothetical protein